MLRFIAAMGVVVFHFGRSVDSLSWGAPLWSISNTGVSFFFFLSGFILSHVYGLRPVGGRRAFYLARAARILPLYLLALSVTAILEMHRGGLAFVDLPLSATLLQAWVPGHSQVLNAPGWSLSVEAFFYLVFPFVLPRLRAIRSSGALLAIAIGAWLVGLALHVVLVEASQGLPSGSPLEDFTYYHPLTHLPTFIVGGASAALFHRHHASMARFGLAMGAIGLVLFFALTWSECDLLRYHHNGLFTPLFAMSVLGIASLPASSSIRGALAWAPVVLLGEISYALYILQQPAMEVYAAVASRAGFALQSDGSFYVFTLALLMVSFAAYRGVEVPCRRILKERFKAHSAPAPVDEARA